MNPEVIICPAKCGNISVNRKRGKCSKCGVKLFYAHNAIIVPALLDDINGFIYLKNQWVSVKDWLLGSNV